MSYTNKKITQAEINAHHVQGATDYLIGNAQQNKAVFDDLPEFIANRINGLIDDLDTQQGEIEGDIETINETLETKADNVDFAGATATEAGEHGLVPPLPPGNRNHVLFGSGQWHQLDIDAWQNNSSVNVSLTTDKSAGGTHIRYSTASIPVATPTRPGAMSATDKSKLDNIASGAEVNVQSDWNETDTASDAFVKNKPTIDATLDPDSANAVQNWRIVEALDQKADDEYTQQQFTLISGYLNGKVDKVSGKGLSANDYTTAEKNKLAGIATGAEVNVQSDWNQANTSADDYIKNKPTIVTPTDLTTAINTEKAERQQADSEVEAKALNAYINKTASGAIATFSDGSTMPMKSCTAQIVPKQSGTGTPSPDNVRQISGWESVSVMVSPTEDEADATTTPVNLGRTVYGGTLDVVSGVLTVDRAMVDGSNLTFTYTGWDNPVYYSNYIAGKTCSADKTGISEVYEIIDYHVNEFQQTRFYIRDETAGGDASVVNSRASGHKFIYYLATPQTYTLTPTEVSTLLGENNVWADSGDVEVVYRADPTLAYQELANAITALGGNV